MCRLTQKGYVSIFSQVFCCYATRPPFSKSRHVKAIIDETRITLTSKGEMAFLPCNEGRWKADYYLHTYEQAVTETDHVPLFFSIPSDMRSLFTPRIQVVVSLHLDHGDPGSGHSCRPLDERCVLDYASSCSCFSNSAPLDRCCLC